jgi:hypothetical protein
VGDGKGQLGSGSLTIDMIEAAAINAILNHGKPTQFFWSNGFISVSKWKNTPYEKYKFIDGDLEPFANLHLLLFKLKVSKYSPKDNYDNINYAAVARIKKIRPKPTEKTLRRIKRREKRRIEDEKLPYYKRGLSWNSRGRI